MDDSKQKTVVAIGNFDGVHKGHAALLAHARKVADAEGLPLVALTFEPHPRAFFDPDAKPFRITPEAVKERRLLACGADRVEILDFNGIMASLSAEMFIDMILVDLLDAAHVVVGNDFQFGHKRTGTLATLERDGRIKVHAAPLESMANAPVSSTRVRACLEAGDMAGANNLLGWDWEIEGTVGHGDKRGRELGYPTANILLGETIAPAYGIYACAVDIGDGVWRKGAASLGLRPMFAVTEPLLEVFVLDWAGDLYDRPVRVRPIKRLRGEMKFDSLEALKIQMAADVEETRRIMS